jgi:myo-inositol-hexaphosphate 3-phosphohydrolase
VSSSATSAPAASSFASYAPTSSSTFVPSHVTSAPASNGSSSPVPGNFSLTWYSDNDCAVLSNASIVAVNPFVGGVGRCLRFLNMSMGPQSMPSYMKVSSCGAAAEYLLFSDAACTTEFSPNSSYIGSGFCGPFSFYVSGSYSFRFVCSSAPPVPRPPPGQRVVTEIRFYSDASCGNLSNASVASVNPLFTSSDSCAFVTRGGEAMYLMAASCGADAAVNVFKDAQCQRYAATITQPNNVCSSTDPAPGSASMRFVCSSQMQNATNATGVTPPPASSATFVPPPVTSAPASNGSSSPVPGNFSLTWYSDNDCAVLSNASIVAVNPFVGGVGRCLRFLNMSMGPQSMPSYMKVSSCGAAAEYLLFSDAACTTEFSPNSSYIGSGFCGPFSFYVSGSYSFRFVCSSAPPVPRPPPGQRVVTEIRFYSDASCGNLSNASVASVNPLFTSSDSCAFVTRGGEAMYLMAASCGADAAVNVFKDAQCQRYAATITQPNNVCSSTDPAPGSASMRFVCSSQMQNATNATGVTPPPASSATFVPPPVTSAPASNGSSSPVPGNFSLTWYSDNDCAVLSNASIVAVNPFVGGVGRCLRFLNMSMGPQSMPSYMKVSSCGAAAEYLLFSDAACTTEFSPNSSYIGSGFCGPFSFYVSGSYSFRFVCSSAPPVPRPPPGQRVVTEIRFYSDASCGNLSNASVASVNPLFTSSDSCAFVTRGGEAMYLMAASCGADAAVNVFKDAQCQRYAATITQPNNVCSSTDPAPGSASMRFVCSSQMQNATNATGVTPPPASSATFVPPPVTSAPASNGSSSPVPGNFSLTWYSDNDCAVLSNASIVAVNPFVGGVGRCLRFLNMSMGPQSMPSYMKVSSCGAAAEYLLFSDAACTTEFSPNSSYIGSGFCGPFSFYVSGSYSFRFVCSSAPPVPRPPPGQRVVTEIRFYSDASCGNLSNASVASVNPLFTSSDSCAFVTRGGEAMYLMAASCGADAAVNVFKDAQCQRYAATITQPNNVCSSTDPAPGSASMRFVCSSQMQNATNATGVTPPPASSATFVPPPVTSAPASNGSSSPVPGNFSLTWYSDNDCAVLSNASIVAVNPFVGGVGRCLRFLNMSMGPQSMPSYMKVSSCGAAAEYLLFSDAACTTEFSPNSSYIGSGFCGPFSFYVSGSYSFRFVCSSAPPVPRPPPGQRVVTEIRFYSDASCGNLSNASVASVNPLFTSSDSCAFVTRGGEAMYLMAASCGADAAVNVFKDAQCQRYAATITQPNNVCSSTDPAPGSASMRFVCSSQMQNATNATGVTPPPASSATFVPPPVTSAPASNGSSSPVPGNFSLTWYSDNDCAVLSNASIVAVNPFVGGVGRCLRFLNMSMGPQSMPSYMKVSSCGAAAEYLLFSDAACTTEFSPNSSYIGSGFCGPFSFYVSGSYSFRFVCSSAPPVPRPPPGQRVVTEIRFYSDASCGNLSNASVASVNPLFTSSDSCAFVTRGGEAMYLMAASCGADAAVNVFKDAQCQRYAATITQPNNVCSSTDPAPGSASMRFVCSTQMQNATNATGVTPPPASYALPGSYNNVSHVSSSVPGVTALPIIIFSSFSLDTPTGTPFSSLVRPNGNFTIIRFDFDPVLQKVVVHGTVFARYLSSSVTAAHIHGPSSLNGTGPVVAVICGSTTSPCNTVSAIPMTNLFEWSQFLPLSGITLNSTLALNGLYYLNIHTLNNLEGELRGQNRPFCAEVCAVPPLPSMSSIRPLLNTSSCTLLDCTFSFVAVAGLFNSIVIFFSSNSTTNINSTFSNVEFQEMRAFPGQNRTAIAIDKFPASFTRGRSFFVQAILNGPFGPSSVSTVYSFDIPVIPIVQILEVDAQFESLILKAKYGVTTTPIEYFEAHFRNSRLEVRPPFALGNDFSYMIVFVYDIMSAAFPRESISNISVRAIFRSSPLLASEFVTFNNVSLPRLPVPKVVSVVQEPSSFSIVIDPLPDNLETVIGFNFSFSSGEPHRFAVEVFRTRDTQFVFSESLMTFLRDMNVSSFVSVKTIFRRSSSGVILSSNFSSPYKFSLLFPPVSPSLFTHQLFRGVQNCVNLSWVSSDPSVIKFRISISSLTNPIFVDGMLRRTSLCSILTEGNVYDAVISSLAMSGTSPAIQLQIRYFMIPQLICRSNPIPSTGLSPNDPPLRALIYNFPVGLNSSSLGLYVLLLRRSQSPVIHTPAMIVSLDVAEDLSAASSISFRTPQFPDLCSDSGFCSSYGVNLCFVGPGNVSVCDENPLMVRSISTATISQISKVSGPTRPKAFIDDLFVTIDQIDSLYIGGDTNFNAIVECVGATGHAGSMHRFDSFAGTAVVRIVPPQVPSATRMIFRVTLQNLRTLAFVPRLNVTFSFEAFDNAQLTELFPVQAIINLDTFVDFQLSSAVVQQASVSFATKISSVVSISNLVQTGSSIVRVKVPTFSLHEASSCTPPAPNCSSIVNATLSVILSGGAVSNFTRAFRLLLPALPRVQALGSLVVDINKLTILNFTISDASQLDRVLIANVTCPFVLDRRATTTVVSVEVAQNRFSTSSLGIVTFQSRDDTGYFTVTADFRVLFRDFLQPSIETLTPSFGPLIGGTHIVVFTKEISESMFQSCMFFNAPCVVVGKFSNVTLSRDMPVTFSEYWSAVASSTLKLLVDANPSSVSSLGVAIIRAPPPSANFSSGNVNVSFTFASKSASKHFFYRPNPSSPASVTSLLPSQVSDLGGQTVQLDVTNLQIVDSRNSIECILGSLSAVANVIDVKYTDTSATVVILVPSLLPGIVEGTIGPKLNIQNRATFQLMVVASVPFIVDPVSVFPSVVYQDFTGNISIRMTGIPPLSFVSNFDLLIGSVAVPRSRMGIILGARRSDSSSLSFSISGLDLDTSISSSLCTLQFNGALQFFNITVLPTISSTVLSSLSSTVGNALGGTVISLTASRFREIIPPQQPRFYVDNSEILNITGIRVVSNKFSTSLSFVTPSMSEGLRQFTVLHPVHFGSNLSFSFRAVLPLRRAEPSVINIRRNATLIRVIVANFVNISSLEIFTRNSFDYSDAITRASILFSQTVSLNSSASLLTIQLPAAKPLTSQSQVIWTVQDASGNATFELTLEALGAPSLASFAPTSVSAYGGNQLTFIVTSFEFPVDLRDWTCSFGFSNVSAQSVTRIDFATVRVQCLAALNFEAITASRTVSCFLNFQRSSNIYNLPFTLTFVAPPFPSLSLPDGSAQIMADSASVFVRNFPPFNSNIDLFRVLIGSVRLPIRSFIIRNDVLQLQFTVSCTDCNCCSGQNFILTVSHTQFPMMTTRASVVIVDPNSPVVVSVSPSIIPASGGSLVEIQVKNFPSAYAVITVSVGNAASAQAFQVISATGSTVTSVRFFFTGSTEWFCWVRHS